ncbi:efflux RND transporter periplasmic adaptor subunit [Legionella shakespearei]|uniref:Multidrug efflux system, subunit A n=1 Tax=Legionella shakespearei DSM 23087 TaxID=1122169 RepID=A0A0W0Z748_9GAMM|nr:efflux RND transporter periplasmic adaptor subunit [Legionella shakespearei]KTD64949.1 multidrug efflux system, subunit A [Legionella shakespearei DSM 23087]
MDANDASDAGEKASIQTKQQLKKPYTSSDFWLIVSLIVMVLSLIWFFYAMRQPKENSPKPLAVVSAKATSRDVPVYLSALGNVTPTYKVTVKTQINGILQQVLFKEGQLVKTGDLLAQIDPRPYEALLTQYEGNLKRDKALLANAKIDLKRYQTLWRQDSIAQQTLATQQALVEQYEGAIKIDEGLIQSTKVSLIYCRIISPIDGRIGLRLVDAGNVVQTGDTTGLAEITTLNPITVIFALPEDNVPQIIPQVYADKTLEVQAYDRQQNKLLATGTLLTIDNHIDPSTGTVRLRATFDNKENTLFPNQFVNVKLLVQTLTKATLVPTQAIQHHLASDFVYLLRPDQTVTVQPVVAGPASGNETVIMQGLKPGQEVITEGTDKLKDGAKVEVQKPSSALVPVQTSLKHSVTRSVV